jgi:hypothetical protein
MALESTIFSASSYALRSARWERAQAIAAIPQEMPAALSGRSNEKLPASGRFCKLSI